MYRYINYIDMWIYKLYRYIQINLNSTVTIVPQQYSNKL